CRLGWRTRSPSLQARLRTHKGDHWVQPRLMSAYPPTETGYGASGRARGSYSDTGLNCREDRERRGADLQLHERCPGGSGRTAGRLWPSQPQGLFGIGVRVDFADRQVPVVERELPPAVLFTLARRLVGEQGPFHFAAVRGRGRARPGDHDPIVPAGVLAGVQARAHDRIARDVAELS